MAQPENYAFIYGQLYSFEELRSCQVIRDEHYAIYNATNLIYGDVDDWLDQLLASRPDLYCDDQIRKRVHALYDFYQNQDNIRAMYGYLEFPEPYRDGPFQ
jgi:hypothetical protein